VIDLARDWEPRLRLSTMSNSYGVPNTVVTWS